MPLFCPVTRSVSASISWRTSSKSVNFSPLQWRNSAYSTKKKHDFMKKIGEFQLEELQLTEDRDSSVLNILGYWFQQTADSFLLRSGKVPLGPSAGTHRTRVVFQPDFYTPHIIFIVLNWDIFSKINIFLWHGQSINIIINFIRIKMINFTAFCVVYVTKDIFKKLII